MYKRSEVEKNALDYFQDSLIANVWLDKYALKAGEDQYIESSPDDTLVRLAKELYRIEMKYQNPMDYDTIYELLKDYNKLVLGGSNLFGIGNTTTLSTLGNCFVVDSPIDSYSGIFKTDQELAQLMKRRGGVGVDISTIRPRGSKVNNAASSSTGAISFLERFSNTTREVAQEGRRGALMVTMDISHPDIEQFVTAKDDNTKITGANISVKVSDEFMKEVEKDGAFELHHLYQKGEEPIIIEAKKLWNKIIHQAWKNGEPGILFWDKVLKESPADCYPEFPTITTNPCSELPLCAYDSCRLAAINIYAYVTDPFTREAKFDYETFKKDVINAQRIMDNIVDLEIEKISAILSKITSDPEPRGLKNVELDLWNRILSKLFFGRRTGLGMMGLADAFAALGYRYAGPESWQLASEIGAAFATSSYYSSITMGKERGSFIIWNRGLEKGNSYISRVLDLMYDFGYTDAYEMYQVTGRRNIANLTIAPTGSISMLAKVSSGIEPVFALTYNRKRKVSADNPNKSIQDKQGDWWEEYTVNHHKFEEELLTRGEGPDVWIQSYYSKSTAHEVDSLDKLELQSIMQKFIDHSISITYNLPNSATEQDVSDLYMKAWKLDLKGLTVYREGSRDGVLTTKKTEDTFPQYDGIKRPKDLYCDVYNVMAKGRPWKIFVGLYDNKPYEIFAVNGKIDKVEIEHGILRRIHSGRYDLLSLDNTLVIEDITHNMTQEEEAFTRIISWALRHGAKLQFGIEQLNKAEGDITSFSKAISRTLKKYCKDGVVRGGECPKCGTIMVSEGGCLTCRQCGNSKCE